MNPEMALCSPASIPDLTEAPSKTSRPLESSPSPAAKINSENLAQSPVKSKWLFAVHIYHAIHHNLTSKKPLTSSKNPRKTLDPLAQKKSRLTLAEKRRAILDLGVGYALILAAIWTPNPWREALYFATLGWIALATWSSFAGWRVMGLRSEGFLRSLWVVGLALVVAAAAVLLAGRLHTLHSPHGSVLLIERFWGYALWSFLQQFLLQGFFLWRLLHLLPDRRYAVLAAASLFALAHLPNPVLTAMTLVWGILASLIFLRYRNLFTVGIAHAVLGISVAVTVPGPIQHDMRVGLGYLRYRPHGFNAPTRTDHVVSTKTRVTVSAPSRRS